MFIVKERNQKTSELFAEARKLFNVWSYYDDKQLDKDFPIPELTERQFNENIEADKEFKNMPWNDLNEKYDIKDFMTLRERLILEIEYFKKTGKHLDNDNLTLCSSRDSDGYVPSMDFSPRDGRVSVGYWHPVLSNGDLRARQAVSSNTSKLETFTLEEIRKLKKLCKILK